jgi:hypothetical protein
MPLVLNSRKPSLVTDTALVCFIVAAVAFSSAVVGTVINYFLAGWMQAGGMVAVGLLYMAIGFFNLGFKEPKSAKTISPDHWLTDEPEEASKPKVNTTTVAFEARKTEDEFVKS